MKLAIEAMRQHVRELEVKRDQAREAANGLKTQLDGALQKANELAAAIVDWNAALAVLSNPPPIEPVRPEVRETKAHGKK